MMTHQVYTTGHKIKYSLGFEVEKEPQDWVRKIPNHDDFFFVNKSSHSWKKALRERKGVLDLCTP